MIFKGGTAIRDGGLSGPFNLFHSDGFARLFRLCNVCSGRSDDGLCQDGRNVAFLLALHSIGNVPQTNVSSADHLSKVRCIRVSKWMRATATEEKVNVLAGQTNERTFKMKVQTNGSATVYFQRPGYCN